MLIRTSSCSQEQHQDKDKNYVLVITESLKTTTRTRSGISGQNWSSGQAPVVLTKTSVTRTRVTTNRTRTGQGPREVPDTWTKTRTDVLGQHSRVEVITTRAGTDLG